MSDNTVEIIFIFFRRRNWNETAIGWIFNSYNSKHFRRKLVSVELHRKLEHVAMFCDHDFR